MKIGVKKVKVSKSFTGAVIIACALWGFTSLNEEYVVLISVPLSVKIPLNRAIENPLPKDIMVEIKGKGWDLFHAKYINVSKEAKLDLRNASINTDEYKVERFEIIKSLSALSNVEAIDIVPNSLLLRTGEIIEKTVRINTRINLDLPQGFILSNEIKVNPQEIIIKGNSKTLKNIDSWNTQNVHIAGVKQSIVKKVPLLDSLSSIIELSTKSVELSFDIQQEAELKIYDVPVLIKGRKLRKDYILQPNLFEITVKGGINLISEVKPEDIKIYLKSKHVTNNTTGLLEAEIVSPKGITLLSPQRILVNVSHFQH